MPNVLFVGTGGAGAGFKGVIQLDNTTTFSAHIGAGGISTWGKTDETTDGDYSLLTDNGTKTVECGGGTRGITYSSSSGTNGTGGSVSIGAGLNIISTDVNSSGSNGAYSGTDPEPLTPGPISGYNFGAAGAANGGYLGGSVQASYNGYIEIVFAGEIR